MCGVPVHAADGYLAAADPPAASRSPSASRWRTRRRRRSAAPKAVVRARGRPLRHARHADRGRAARAAPPQLSRRAGRGRRRARPRLARHLDRRFRRGAGRGRPSSARRSPASSRASCCCPTGCCTSRQLSSCSATGRPRCRRCPPRRFDSENGRRRLEALYGVAGARRLRQLHPRRAGRRRRARRLCRADPGAASCRALAAAARVRPGRAPGDRRRDARAISSCCAASSGERQGILLAAIDRTRTGAGARLLAAWLAAPLTDPAGDRRAARTWCAGFVAATSCCASPCASA